MPQQINLLNDLPKPPRYYLSEKLIFLIVGGYLGILLLITFVQFFIIGIEKYSIARLQKVYIASQIEFNNNSQLAKNSAVDELEKKLAEKNELLQTLQSRKVTSNQCAFLSYYFEAFARSTTPGLWLTRISIDLGHSLMDLSGLTYLPSLPIRLIQNIQKINCFNQQQFGPLELMNPSLSNNKNDTENNLKLPNTNKRTQNDSILEFTLKLSPKLNT